MWDASEVHDKNLPKESVGSYTKYPMLSRLTKVKPSLSYIIDERSIYNELGITLTDNNFRLEYDDNVPETLKYKVDLINKKS